MTYAIFSEWTRDGDVRQDLFIPSVSLGAKHLGPTLWTREFAETGGRRKWNAVPNTAYHPTGEQHTVTEDILRHEVEQYEGISNWMVGVAADPQWSLRDAFPVLVSTSDLLWFSEKPTVMSADLAERINSLRTLKGHPVVGGVR